MFIQNLPCIPVNGDVHPIMLLAFNNRTRKAVAFVGTYPYDLRDASHGEHALIVIHGFDECSRLYSAYVPLLDNKAAKSYGR